MDAMFSNATDFNQDIGLWNVQNVINMSSMFNNATSFNQNIGLWDVYNVTDMSNMFNNATNFNQDISLWNVQNVINMSNMFNNATSFNENIGLWNVQNVINMSDMFASSKFNQPIGNWNVQNVINMSAMFAGCTDFNQDISKWNTSKVINMEAMFGQAKSFNQNIGNWKVQNVKDMTAMFDDCGLSYKNYDKILLGWSKLKNLSKNIILGARKIFYTNKKARFILTSAPNKWRIYGDRYKKIVCFNEGTKILCSINMKEQYIPVQMLKVGDLVKTYNHGYRKIVKIIKGILINEPNNYKRCMYIMKKNNNNGLIDDLIITGNHPFFVDNLQPNEYSMQKNHFIQKIHNKYLLLSYISQKFKSIKDNDVYNYYNFILECDVTSNYSKFGVYANGLLVEIHNNKKLNKNNDFINKIILKKLQQK
jgi:surface protein